MVMKNSGCIKKLFVMHSREKIVILIILIFTLQSKRFNSEINRKTLSVRIL